MPKLLAARVSLRSGTCRSCRPKPQCQARRSPRRFCPACAARRSARGLKRRKSGLRSEWSRRASCRVRTAKAVRARRCCGRSRTPQALLRGCTVRRAQRLPPCIAARRRRFPQWCAQVRQSADCCWKRLRFSNFCVSSGCCGRSFSGAAPRAFFASFAANICCAAAFTASFAAEARFPRGVNASSSAAVSCSSTRMRLPYSVISKVICAASRTASMALNWRRALQSGAAGGKRGVVAAFDLHKRFARFGASSFLCAVAPALQKAFALR